MEITITEALAELKTISKRVEKKEQFVSRYLLRQEALKDPLEKDGGSFNAIQEEQQAIHDLQERKITIRRAIQEANMEEYIVLGKTKRTIADWLVWRRDVAPYTKNFFDVLSSQIERTRTEATRKGLTVVSGEASKPTDIVVNLNEKILSEKIEALEEVLGTLDGQLSLKNATILIDVK